MNATVYGLDWDPDRCDRAYFEIHNHLGEEDVYLYGKKWFDYRFMHDIHAAFLFVDAFNRAYVAAYERVFSISHGDNLRGVNPETVFDCKAYIEAQKAKRSNAKKRVQAKLDEGFDVTWAKALQKDWWTQRTGIWKARQWADMLGMPYDAYCRIALTWATSRKRKHMPRPSQLYGFDLLTAIQDTWAQEQRARIWVSSDPRYRNDRFEGAPAQVDHRNWLIEQAKLRSNPVPMLARLCYTDEVLPAQTVAAHFGADMIQRMHESIS